MRTIIDIDDALVNRALKVSGLPTQRAAIEEGLRLLIKRAQARVRELFGKVPLEIDLGQIRQGRQS